MSKKRIAAKYTVAGAVTLVNVAGLYRQLTRPLPGDLPVTRRQVVIVGSSMLAATWLAILL